MDPQDLLLLAERRRDECERLSSDLMKERQRVEEAEVAMAGMRAQIKSAEHDKSDLEFTVSRLERERGFAQRQLIWTQDQLRRSERESSDAQRDQVGSIFVLHTPQAESVATLRCQLDVACEDVLTLRASLDRKDEDLDSAHALLALSENATQSARLELVSRNEAHERELASQSRLFDSLVEKEANTQRLLDESRIEIDRLHETLEFQQDSDALRRENIRLSREMAQINDALEASAPALRIQREEAQNAQQIPQLKETIRELASKLASAEALAAESTDLSRQVQLLLKEGDDAARGGQEPLVPFRNIEELQMRNQELLRAVRHLAQKSSPDAIPLELQSLRALRDRQSERVMDLVRERDSTRSLLADIHHLEGAHVSAVPLKAEIQQLRTDHIAALAESQSTVSKQRDLIHSLREELFNANAQLKVRQNGHQTESNTSMQELTVRAVAAETAGAITRRDLASVQAAHANCKDEISRLSNQIVVLSTQLKDESIAPYTQDDSDVRETLQMLTEKASQRNAAEARLVAEVTQLNSSLEASRAAEATTRTALLESSERMEEMHKDFHAQISHLKENLASEQHSFKQIQMKAEAAQSEAEREREHCAGVEQRLKEALMQLKARQDPDNPAARFGHVLAQAEERHDSIALEDARQHAQLFKNLAEAAEAQVGVLRSQIAQSENHIKTLESELSQKQMVDQQNEELVDQLEMTQHRLHEQDQRVAYYKDLESQIAVLKAAEPVHSVVDMQNQLDSLQAQCNTLASERDSALHLRESEDIEKVVSDLRAQNERLHGILEQQSSEDDRREVIAFIRQERDAAQIASTCAQQETAAAKARADHAVSIATSLEAQLAELQTDKSANIEYEALLSQVEEMSSLRERLAVAEQQVKTLSDLDHLRQTDVPVPQEQHQPQQEVGAWETRSRQLQAHAQALAKREAEHLAEINSLRQQLSESEEAVDVVEDIQDLKATVAQVLSDQEPSDEIRKIISDTMRQLAVERGKTEKLMSRLQSAHRMLREKGGEEEIEKDDSDLRAQLEAATGRVGRLREHAKFWKERYEQQKVDGGAAQTLRDQLKEVQEKLSASESRNSVMAENLKHWQSEYKRAVEKVVDVESNVSRLEASLLAADQLKESLINERDALSHHVKVVEERLNDARKEAEVEAALVEQKHMAELAKAKAEDERPVRKRVLSDVSEEEEEPERSRPRMRLWDSGPRLLDSLDANAKPDDMFGPVGGLPVPVQNRAFQDAVKEEEEEKPLIAAPTFSTSAFGDWGKQDDEEEY